MAISKNGRILATSKNGKGQVVVVAKQLIAGTGKHLSSATPVAFAGGSFTGDQITSKLQALVDLRSEVDAAQLRRRLVTHRPPCYAEAL